jgi:uncharacterized membrane protein
MTLALGRRKRRSFLGIGGRKRKAMPAASTLAGAAVTVAAAVPVARRAGAMLGRGRQIADQATDVLDTASGIKDAVSSHSSTIGKVGGLISEVRHLGGSSHGGGSKPKLSHLIEQHTDISAPRSNVYNQWTQMEMFATITKGVESVSQDEDDKTSWTSKIGPSRRSWTGRIVEQVPDERIAWKSEGGAQHQGVVTFHSLDTDLTRVLVQLEYQPKGPIETVGNTLRIQRRRVKRDLRLFKHFIELRGEETGAWRGRIEKEEGLEPRLAGQSSDGQDGKNGGGQNSGGGGRGGRGRQSSGRQSNGRQSSSGRQTRGRASRSQDSNSNGAASARRGGGSRSGGRPSSPPRKRAGAASGSGRR